MNIHTYGSYYGKFHQCSVSFARDHLIVLHFETSPYETWLVSRMYPPDLVSIDSNKPLLLAFKTFFKSDVPASVVCHSQYLWTAILGSERAVYPISEDLVDPANKNHLRMVATPYYVTDPNVLRRYLTNQIRPAYDHVFFYKNAILYLDPEDLPYPGGNYFAERDPTAYYRLCFLSDEPTEYLSTLADEWRSRQGITVVPYMTREIQVIPKFVDFQPLSESHLQEAHIVSTSLFHKTLSSKKPEHLLQDVLNAYYQNRARRSLSECPAEPLGLLVEWPIFLTYEGARPSGSGECGKQFVALAVNGIHPNRVLHVHRPYDRYVEGTHVPATLWTPISYQPTTLLTDPSIQKVAIDSVVIGVGYRDAFLCFSQPLLEGKPMKKPTLNTHLLLSTATFEPGTDKNLSILSKTRVSEHHSLYHVTLRGLPSHNAWFLTKASETDFHPKKTKLPWLVKQWTDFFQEVGTNAWDVDVGVVRLALMLCKHNVCFQLNAEEKSNEIIRLSEKDIRFNLHEKVVQFINDVRFKKSEAIESKTCTIA